MKTYTDDEIKAKVTELWLDETKYRSVPDKIEVAQGTGLVVITLSSMYEAPGFSFEKLQALAQYFDTMNVETESEFAHGGCETCDYGSEYGFSLHVRDGKPFQQLSVG